MKNTLRGLNNLFVYESNVFLNTNQYSRYNIKKAIRRWPFLLFCLSFILFLLVIFPNVIYHRLPIFGEWPCVLYLEGRVVETKSVNGSIIKNGVENVLIEIGGYRTHTNKDGYFELKFVSKLVEDIPTIIKKGNYHEIKRISYSDYKYKIIVEFEFNVS